MILKDCKWTIGSNFTYDFKINNQAVVGGVMKDWKLALVRNGILREKFLDEKKIQNKLWKSINTSNEWKIIYPNWDNAKKIVGQILCLKEGLNCTVKYNIHRNAPTKFYLTNLFEARKVWRKYEVYQMGII
jgi:hypothetical protein